MLVSASWKLKRLMMSFKFGKESF